MRHGQVAGQDLEGRPLRVDCVGRVRLDKLLRLLAGEEKEGGRVARLTSSNLFLIPVIGSIARGTR